MTVSRPSTPFAPRAWTVPASGDYHGRSGKDGLPGAFQIDEDLETMFIGEPDHLK